MRQLLLAPGAVILLHQLALAQPTAPKAAEYEPMTQAERFHHFVSGTFSVEPLLRSAAGAAILQATNTPSEWRQGTEAYAERFASSYAQHIVSQTVMYGAADLLHEDNRFFPSESRGAGARLKSAVESAFLARKDDGTRRLSYSRLGGIVAAAFLSREWQPRSTSGVGSAISSAGNTLGAEVAFNIAREFMPKVFRRL